MIDQHNNPDSKESEGTDERFYVNADDLISAWVKRLELPEDKSYYRQLRRFSVLSDSYRNLG